MKLRTKLLLYFIAIITLSGAVYALQHRTNEQVFDMYEENLDQFLQLNAVSTQANDSYDALYLYALEPVREHYLAYRQEMADLNRTVNWVDDLIEETSSSYELNNYRNMLTYLQSELRAAETGIVVNDVQVYSAHLTEAESAVEYIDETTLMLIDSQLNAYEEVATLSEEKMTAVQRAGIALMIFVLSSGLLIAYLFTYRSTATIESMIYSAKEIAAGDFGGADVKTKVKDELWFLSETFNDMKRNVRDNVVAIEEKARLARLLKEAELRSLQNQINPHFLFNTLNTLSRLAYVEGAKESSELMNSVSRLLRYNLRDIDRPTALGDELEVMEAYLTIQKTRFQGRITVVMAVDDDCLHVSVPALTLQPLIENAFIHGVEDMTKGAEINVRVKRDADAVQITVADNGAGMQERKIEDIMKRVEEGALTGQETTGHSTGIGLPNVIARLRYFNSAIDVTIDSAIGTGTTVTLTIPDQEEATKDDDTDLTG
ncbi:sensor histidine kinase [Salisediminibacterium beveridgei]|uniref:histidine kinase n=1 Tax=Salisediminibacterium beveridgei TaxID=632773 RepID=A0A1D7QRE7_9BACI|nr:sensor histidine kinase [Salisediminibacterium beveridgei]AOM81587.1 Autolysin sensor kinase [Salisediminibacterium beveridgei]